MSLSFVHTTLGQRVLFGTGRARENLSESVRRLNAKRLLLIHDASIVAIADEMTVGLPIAVRIGKVSQHVPIEDVQEVQSTAVASGVDAIVTVGGGSATGLAKAVALRLGLPIIAVPTTFAGSEATDVWGTTEGNKKTTGSDPAVVPAVIVYDASLSSSLPLELAFASGLNAIAHAVDGFWAPRADPINTALGAEGLRALAAGLRGVRAQADDLRAREETLYGAYLAAVAFASSGSGLHHKICHTLGGAYGLPHAQMHAVVLPYVVAFNEGAAPAAAGRVTAVLGGDNAAVALARFAATLGAPKSLREIGFGEKDISEAASLILPAAPPTNPRPVSKAGLETILRAAWAGASVESLE
jgi:maleylacetate reductase